MTKEQTALMPRYAVLRDRVRGYNWRHDHAGATRAGKAKALHEEKMKAELGDDWKGLYADWLEARHEDGETYDKIM